jgi:hypothetical protein
MSGGIRGYFSETWQAWNEFWFAPTDPSTLSAIRVFAGAMLLYTHAVWTIDLEAFFGTKGWLSPEVMSEVRGVMSDPEHPRWIFSLFDYIGSPVLLWSVHIFALMVFAALMFGFFSRTAAVLAYLLAISYAQRVTPGAFFGLDKINCMLALYLMLGPCGARYSLDRLWRLRRGGDMRVFPSSSANIAIRLIQLHMCIIYLFSGLAKLQGPSWWDGEAIWMSVANLEYQSFDLTWMARYPWIYNLLTHLTVFWELTYSFLVWNRFTRPWVLFLAVMIHGGIALFMGMATFGLVMLIGNVAFISPDTIRRWFDPFARRVSLMLAGSAVSGGRQGDMEKGRQGAV